MCFLSVDYYPDLVDVCGAGPEPRLAERVDGRVQHRLVKVYDERELAGRMHARKVRVAAGHVAPNKHAARGVAVAKHTHHLAHINPAHTQSQLQ